MLEQMLRQRGFSVSVARDGAEALGIVGTVRPDIILLDIMMPEMNGFTVLEKLKSDESTRTIPVVIVSARGHDDDMVDGYLAGAEYYITKPFTSSQLMYGIGTVLNSTSPAMLDDAATRDAGASTRRH